MLLFSQVGILKELLTDQGTPFMSKLMNDLCLLLQVHHLHTSVYHPQTNRLMERYNQTLKRMLPKAVTEKGWYWDLLLSYILFATWETPHASRHLKSSLEGDPGDVTKEAWETQLFPSGQSLNIFNKCKRKFILSTPIVKEHMEAAQREQLPLKAI